MLQVTGEVRVEFLDYGNIETVNVTDIRIDNIFYDVPPQCLKCQIHGIVPVSVD